MTLIEMVLTALLNLPRVWAYHRVGGLGEKHTVVYFLLFGMKYDSLTLKGHLPYGK